MTTATDARRKMTALIKAHTDRTLIVTMLTTAETMKGLERGCDEWKAQHIVSMAVIDELETRYDVEDAMNAWADDLDSGLSYEEALLAALPKAVTA